jgi:hypothetical protein
LPSGYLFELRPAFAGVGPAELEYHLKKSSESLAFGRHDQAIAELMQASGINARAPQSAVSDVYLGEDLLLTLTVDSRRGTVSIRYSPTPGHATPTHAALLSSATGELLAMTELKPVEGETYWLAEFTECPSGVLSVALGQHR